MTATLLIFALGACRAIDGDTIRCGQERLRLARIDTPEIGQPGAIEATKFLRLQIDGKTVICTFSRHDPYGRPIAECWAGAGPSLSDQLLAAGLAEPYRGRR